MLGDPKEVQRDQQSFDHWWGQRHFFIKGNPLHGIYKELYLQGADIEFIDRLVSSLQAIDRVHDMCQELGTKRRGSPQTEPPTDPALRYAHDLFGPYTPPTKGKMRQTWISLSHFMADGLVPESDGTKQVFTPIQKEDLGGFLLEAFAANPEDYRSGGNSDRCGSFFLLLITEHFKETRVKPRDSLAARLLRSTRRQQSEPAALEAARVKKRVHKFKLETHDWQWRIRHFTKKLRYLFTT